MQFTFLKKKILWVCSLLLFVSALSGMCDSSKVHFEESIVASLNFDAESVSILFNDEQKQMLYIKHPELYTEIQIYCLHLRLWELNFDMAEEEYQDLKEYSRQNNFLELEKRLELFEYLKLAHERAFLTANQGLIKYLEEYKSSFGAHPDSILWKPYLAFTHHFSHGDFELAHDLYLESINDLQNRFHEKTNFERVLNLLLGIFYHYQNNFESSNFILNNLIEECETDVLCKKKLQAVLYRWLAGFEVNMGNVEKGLQLAQKGFDLSTNDYQKGFNAIVLGKAHGLLGNQDKMIEFYERSKASLLKVFGPHPEYTNAVNEYVESLAKMGLMDKVIQQQEEFEIMDGFEASSYGGNIVIPRILYEHFMEAEEYKKAAMQIQKIWINQGHIIDSHSEYSNPEKFDFTVHRDSPYTFDLKSRACLEAYKKDRLSNEMFLHLACEAANSSAYHFDRLFERSNSKNSRSLLLKENAKLIKTQIESAYELYLLEPSRTHFENIVFFMEKSQALDMFHGMAERPECLTPQLDALFIKRNRLLKEFSHTEAKAIQDSTFLDHERSLESINTEIHNIETQIRQLDKNWSEKVFNQQSVSENIWKFKDRHIIHYFYNEEFLYIAEIFEDQYSIQQLLIPLDFDSRIKSLVDAINAPFVLKDKANPVSRDAYQFQLNWLSEYLFLPLKFNHDKMLLVPDKKISLIPFELFYVDEEWNIPIINYQHSIQSLNRIKAKPSEKVEQVALFQPIFPENLEKFSSVDSYRGEFLGQLIFAPKEIKGITEILDGIGIKPEFGSSSISFFEKSILDNDIVHVVSHAKQNLSDNKYSFIAFNDEKKQIKKLYFNELQEMKSNAQMLVLSACETGIGTMVEGEGLASFGKSFLSNGASSVVSTLWTVNDQSSSKIMVNFYKYLSKGQDKDLALRNAKLDYIHSSPSELQHPYYWSGITVSGDFSALKFSSSSNRYLWLICMLIGITSFALLFLLKR